MRLWLALLFVPTLVEAQVPVDELGLPIRPTEPQTSFSTSGHPLSPGVQSVQVQIRTRRPEESLDVVVGYELPLYGLTGRRPRGQGTPVRRLVCAGGCTVTLLVGQRYELMVEPAPEDARFESRRFPHVAAVTITERTVALDVTFNPRNAQRRRRWLGIAGTMLVGGAMMGGSIARSGSTDTAAFWTGLSISIFAPCFLALPLMTFGHTEVERIEAPVDL